MAWKKASTTAAAQPRLFACFSQISQFSFFVQKHLSPQPMLLSTYDSPWLFHISKNNHLITRLRTFLSYLSASVGCLKRYVELTPKCKNKYCFFKILTPRPILDRWFVESLVWYGTFFYFHHHSKMVRLGPQARCPRGKGMSQQFVKSWLQLRMLALV